MTTTTKPSIRRILRAIIDGDSWCASNKNVSIILINGWAFFDYDAGEWSITAEGRKAAGAEAPIQGR
jgi:hypothetical protein